MEITTRSKDGLPVWIKLQQKRDKEISRRETGGDKAFISRAGRGFFVTVKSVPSANPNVLTETVRSRIFEISKRKPVVMPFSWKSGLIVFEVDDVDPKISENDIANAISGAIKQVDIDKSVTNNSGIRVDAPEICHMHACGKTAVSRCVYCGKSFCSEHKDASLLDLPRFRYSKKEDKYSSLRYAVKGGHPCMRYTVDVVQMGEGEYPFGTPNEEVMREMESSGELASYRKDFYGLALDQLIRMDPIKTSRGRAGNRGSSVREKLRRAQKVTYDGDGLPVPDYEGHRSMGGFLKTVSVLIVLSLGYFVGHFWPPAEIFRDYLYVFWNLPLIANVIIFARQNWLLLAPVAFFLFIATAILIISLRGK